MLSPTIRKSYVNLKEFKYLRLAIVKKMLPNNCKIIAIASKGLGEALGVRQVYTPIYGGNQPKAAGNTHNWAWKY